MTEPKHDPPTKTGPPGRRSWSTGIVLGFSALLVLMLGLTWLLARSTRYPDQSLPIVLVGGISVFLVALTLVVMVFRRLGLTDKAFPLGLPDGSIRAFIALSLILLFFIMVVFFFFDAPTPASTNKISDLTADQFKAIPASQLNFEFKQPNGDYTVMLNVQSPQSSTDLAKQVTTTISTLVVAIASFYFGSTSVASVRQHKPNNGQTTDTTTVDTEA